MPGYNDANNDCFRKKTLHFLAPPSDRHFRFWLTRIISYSAPPCIFHVGGSQTALFHSVHLLIKSSWFRDNERLQSLTMVTVWHSSPRRITELVRERGEREGGLVNVKIDCSGCWKRDVWQLSWGSHFRSHLFNNSFVFVIVLSLFFSTKKKPFSFLVILMEAPF